VNGQVALTSSTAVPAGTPSSSFSGGTTPGATGVGQKLKIGICLYSTGTSCQPGYGSGGLPVGAALDGAQTWTTIVTSHTGRVGHLINYSMFHNLMVPLFPHATLETTINVGVYAKVLHDGPVTTTQWKAIHGGLAPAFNLNIFLAQLF
jgi:hypothetical protein